MSDPQWVSSVLKEEQGNVIDNQGKARYGACNGYRETTRNSNGGVADQTDQHVCHPSFLQKDAFRLQYSARGSGSLSTTPITRSL